MKVILDFDDPDPLPLKDWLHILRLARTQHEFKKRRSKSEAAHQLGISRYTVYRILADGRDHDL